jgi:hypothetical protein
MSRPAGAAAAAPRSAVWIEIGDEDVVEMERASTALIEDPTGPCWVYVSKRAFIG